MGGRRKIRVIALIATAAIVIAACGDDSSSGNAQTGPTSTGASAPATTLTPQIGGTITMAEYLQSAGLDPVVSIGGGVGGSSEAAAIFDTLTVWNEQTHKFDPKTAEAVTSSADQTEWTIKLRSGIKFTDNTDYNAEAVMYGINRFRSGLASAPPCEELRNCPRNTSASGSAVSTVSDMQVVDPLTLKVKFSEPTPLFAASLSTTVGMIPSPTALKAACPTDKSKTAANCSFNQAPVGAGPFVIDSFKAGESITLKRNPNYWGGKVYLDGLTFVTLNDSGSDKTYAALKAGTAQVAFLRQWPAVADSVADKFPGHDSELYAGTVLLMNNGVTITCAGGQPAACAGKPDGPYTPVVPTANPLVRQAIASAVDVIQLDQRVYNGKGRPGTEFVQKSNPYYPNVPGPKYDVEQAKKLVAQAKAQGWDGKVRFVCDNTAFGQNWSQSVQAMLGAVGIEVTTKAVQTVAAEISVARDYDLGCYGIAGFPDDTSFSNVIAQLRSTSPTNRMGYKSADMDAALNLLLNAKTDADKTAAFKRISEVYTKDVPMLVVGTIPERVAWTPKLHDVTVGAQSLTTFEKAWLQK